MTVSDKSTVSEKSTASDKNAAKRAAGEADVRAAIAAMPEPDRGVGERLHALITACAPSLAPKTWYGMPAYARNDKVVCFFRSTHKFKERYMTLGFNDGAALDDGALWPIGYALTALTDAEEARIGEIIKRAAG